MASPAIIVAGLLLSASGSVAQDKPLPEATGSTIGYETVASALADLRSRPSVVFTTENGWTIAIDRRLERFGLSLPRIIQPIQP